MQAVFYRSVDGKEPVDDFIERLSIKRQVAIDNQIDRLNELTNSDPPVPFPHSSQVDGELRELADFKSRMDTRVRRPPRAAGHDAPPSRP